MNDKETFGTRIAFMSELQKLKINSPNGFAIPSEFLIHFYQISGVIDEIKGIEEGINTENCSDLEERALSLRNRILENEFPKDLRDMIDEAYSNFKFQNKCNLVIRPSGLDFGDYKIFVHDKQELYQQIKEAIALIFSDDHFIYRGMYQYLIFLETVGKNHMDKRICLSVEETIDFQEGFSGECYTSDIEFGKKLMYISSMKGRVIAEIQKGIIHPNEFWLFKKNIFTHQPIVKKYIREKEPLDSKHIIDLSRKCLEIEKSFLNLVKNIELKIEWKKPKDSDFFITSVLPLDSGFRVNRACIEEYQLNGSQELITEGIAIGHQIVTGNAFVSKKPKIPPPNSILVTKNASYKWRITIKHCQGLVLDQGGLTSYAAIIAREMGIPCIIQTKNVTEKVKNGDMITLDCSSGDGKVWKGAVMFNVNTKECLTKHPNIETDIMIELDIPDIAGRYSDLPFKGVGEISLNMVLKDCEIDPYKIINKENFKEKISESIGYVCALFHPYPVYLKLEEIKNHESFHTFWKVFFETIDNIKDKIGIDNLMFMIEEYKFIDQKKFILKLFDDHYIGKEKRFFIHKNPTKEIDLAKVKENFNGLIMDFNDYLDIHPLKNKILFEIIQELQKRCNDFRLKVGVHLEVINEELLTHLYQLKVSMITVPPIDLPFTMKIAQKLDHP